MQCDARLAGGVAAVLGISTGCSVHVLAAAIGLSALLATSATAFTVVKPVGALYLMYLGISPPRSGSPGSKPGAELAHSPLSTIFGQGFLTNVLNPKVALSFLAFVPQFIEPSAPNKALAFVFFGAIFTFNGTLWCLFLAWSANHLRRLEVSPETGELAHAGGRWHLRAPRPEAGVQQTELSDLWINGGIDLKTIGLIGGMSWESTAHYYQQINEQIKQRLGGLHSARIVLYSVDFHDIERLQAAGKWNEAGECLAAAARALVAAGAEFLVQVLN